MRGNARASILAPVFLLIASPVLSGCLTSNAEEAPEAEDGTKIEYSDTAQASLAFSEGNASIAGEVRSDAGFGIPDVHVAILGTDLSARTNRTGHFQFADIKPGDYKLRADGPEYYTAAEVRLELVPNKVAVVIVTLMPRSGLGGGDVPHGHDYWADRAEVVVADADFKYHRYSDDGGSYYYTVIKPVMESPAYRGASPSRCTAPTSGAASEFWFNDDTQTVWPGTSKIEVKLAWNAAETYNVNGLSVGWSHAADGPGKSNLTKLYKNGESITIDVKPNMWDHGHQPFTFWRFWACLVGNDETGTIAGRFFLGNFHVTMKLIKGEQPNLEPPHPKFWEAGDRVPVLSHWLNASCTSTTGGLTNGNQCVVGAYWGTTWGGRSRAGHYSYKDGENNAFWTVRPKGSALVPPGTGIVEIALSWTWSPAQADALSVMYSAADVSPRLKGTLAAYKTMEPAEKTPNSRTYRLEVKPTEPDAFYQTVSRWAFLWGYEGEEKSAQWVSKCVCELRLQLKVEALRNQNYGEA